MDKILIIVRHAHRDTSVREADNGLSKKGKAQAEQAAEFFKKRFSKEKIPLWSSPKKRCRETLAPLAERLGVNVEVQAFLNEAQRVEDLVTHCEKFHELWIKSPHPFLVICSHGDWIPHYLRTVVGQPIALAKGGWAQVETHTGIGRESSQLTWLVQDFDFL